MKIRNGFVTNSSSSSFICDVCDRVESGYDVSLSDAEMCECRKCHTFCEDEINNNVTIETKIKVLIREYNDGFSFYYSDTVNEIEELLGEDYEKFFSDIMNYDSVNNGRINEYIDNLFEMITNIEEHRDTVIPEFCPICSYKHIPDDKLIEYACKELKIGRQDLIDIVRQKLINDEF